MTRQYSTRTFLRHAPNALLKKYLEKYGIGEDLDWSSLKETKIDLIAVVIDEASPETRAQLERDFQDINAMATEAGTKTLIDEGRSRHHKVELAEILGRMDDHYDRAFWVFLEHPKIFNVARQFIYADNLPGRSWRKRRNLPSAEPATNAESRCQLALAVSDYYRSREGRGDACIVEHYEREAKLYWFVYPEDYASTSIEYDPQGEFSRATRRPAFEIIFAYSQEECSLDLFVEGRAEIVGSLQEIWGRTILGIDLEPVGKTDVVYKLNPLIDRGFKFTWDPSDGIEDVRIKKLRLSVLSQKGNKRIILEADVSKIRDAVYDLLDDILEGTRISKTLIAITQVGFQFVFRPDDRGGGQKVLNFDVSYPNSCSLKYEPKHEIARKYLRLWKIDVSGNSK